jgi:Fe-S-cluster containining protein
MLSASWLISWYVRVADRILIWAGTFSDRVLSATDCPDDWSQLDRVEDISICTNCGGRCCKTAPGRFAPDDLLMLYGAVQTKTVSMMLDDGIAAITLGLVGALNSRLAPIFTLAARGLNEPSLCLCLDTARCTHLGSSGCSFELDKRPLECAAIIPSTSQCKLPGKTKMEDYWVPHQETLRKVVEYRAGKPWHDELKGQVFDLKRNDSYAKGARRLIEQRGLALEPDDIRKIADMAKALPF